MQRRMLVAISIGVGILFQSCATDSGGSGKQVSGPPPDIDLSASRKIGSIPLQVQFELTFLESSEYTIDRIKWDLDGDGSIDTTLIPEQPGIAQNDSYSVSAVFLNPGVFEPKVTVVYNENNAESFGYLQYEFMDIPGKGQVYTDSIYVSE